MDFILNPSIINLLIILFHYGSIDNCTILLSNLLSMNIDSFSVIEVLAIIALLSIKDCEIKCSTYKA